MSKSSSENVEVFDDYLENEEVGIRDKSGKVRKFFVCVFDAEGWTKYQETIMSRGELNMETGEVKMKNPCGLDVITLSLSLRDVDMQLVGVDVINTFPHPTVEKLTAKAQKINALSKKDEDEAKKELPETN